MAFLVSQLISFKFVLPKKIPLKKCGNHGISPLKIFRYATAPRMSYSCCNSNLIFCFVVICPEVSITIGDN